MLTELLKCFAVGVCASAPLGPVAVQVLQRSLAYGRRAGLVSGLGAATVDTSYAVVSIFFLGLFRGFIDSHSLLIMIIGGALLTALGLIIAISNPFRERRRVNRVSASFYFQTMGTALSNPGALFMMLALITLFGLGDAASSPWVAPGILCVAAGTFTWWFTFSWAVAKLRDKLEIKTLLLLSRIAGGVVAAFGIVLIVKSLLMI